MGLQGRSIDRILNTTSHQVDAINHANSNIGTNTPVDYGNTSLLHMMCDIIYLVKHLFL